MEPPRGTFPYFSNKINSTRVATKLDTPSSVPLVPEIFQPCHSPHFMAPLHPPIICRAKAIAPSALDFFTCRVACSLDHICLFHFPYLGIITTPHLRHGTASFLQDLDHIPPLLPGTVTAALVPSRGQTALHRPAPSGVRAGHGPPGHLPIGSGRLGVPVAHLAQANSDPFPGHIPARLRPLGYWQNTRLGPTRILASSHVT